MLDENYWNTTSAIHIYVMLLKSKIFNYIVIIKIK